MNKAIVILATVLVLSIVSIICGLVDMASLAGGRMARLDICNISTGKQVTDEDVDRIGTGQGKSLWMSSDAVTGIVMSSNPGCSYVHYGNNKIPVVGKPTDIWCKLWGGAICEAINK
jgi:hypothetical protein